MKKKGHTPITRVKNPEPNIESPDWVIWAEIGRAHVRTPVTA